VGVRATALLVTMAACGAGHPRAVAPDGADAAIPIIGLEAVHRSDSLDTVRRRLGGEPAEGGLWIEDLSIEGRAASVGLRYTSDALTGVTVAFHSDCDAIAGLASTFDDRLGARTSAEPGIAAWSHAGWDLALSCDTSRGEGWPRLDIHPAAGF